MNECSVNRDWLDRTPTALRWPAVVAYVLWNTIAAIGILIVTGLTEAGHLVADIYTAPNNVHPATRPARFVWYGAKSVWTGFLLLLAWVAGAMVVGLALWAVFGYFRILLEA